MGETVKFLYSHGQGRHQNYHQPLSFQHPPSLTEAMCFVQQEHFNVSPPFSFSFCFSLLAAEALGRFLPPDAFLPLSVTSGAVQLKNKSERKTQLQ